MSDRIRSGSAYSYHARLELFVLERMVKAEESRRLVVDGLEISQLLCEFVLEAILCSGLTAIGLRSRM